MEDWTDIRLQSMPDELQSKRILGFLFKKIKEKEKVLIILFEGGIIGSFKIEVIREDDYVSNLLRLENDFYYDILIPIFFAFIATISIYLKRRMNSRY